MSIDLADGQVAVGPCGDRPGWTVPGGIPDVDRARLAEHVGNAPVGVSLAAEDRFAVTVRVDAPVTRAGVATALAGVSPVPLSGVDWGWRAEGDGQVRVVMAHRDRVDAILRALGLRSAAVVGDGIIVRPARVPLSPWWLLAAIPLVTGMGAWGLTMAIQHGARPVSDDKRAVLAFRRVAVSEILALLDAGLPAGATVHRAERQGDGAMLLEIDTADPETVRAALAGDRVLATFRTTAQEAVADRGIRVHLRSDRL